MKGRLAYLIRVYLQTVLVFIAAKVVFMLCNHDATPELTMADVWQVLRHGLSLDLSMSLYLLIIPLLTAIASIWTRLPRWMLRPYWALIAVALSLAFVADTSLYPFWHFKLDASCLQYLETPTEAMASVSTAYLLWRCLLVVLTTVLIYAIFALRTLSLRPESTVLRKIVHTVLFVLTFPFIVIGIRGGLGESTTNIGQVYFSQNQFLNHAAVNPVFSFLSSFEKTASNVPDYQFMSEEERAALMADLYPTVSQQPDTLLSTRRPDVVIILMESCGEVFSPYMPRLQQLKQEGIYFSHCYANSWRTDRGTVCTWSAYPSFPTASVMKMPSKTRFLPSIARTLAAEGYETTYLYGGDINFTNMRSYLMGTGFSRIVWMEDYSKDEQHTAKWGVRDDITFSTLGDMLSQKHEKPLLIGYSTLSSHEPWDVPLHQYDDKMANAFCYLDNCIGQFIDRMRQTPQWQNLLIVLLPDHGIDCNGVSNGHQERNHIPLIWMGGAVKNARQVDVTCNQTDLAATLLGQMSLPHADFKYSRDVLSRNYVHPFAVHTYNNGIEVRDSSTYAVYDLDSHRLTVGDEARSQTLIDRGKAVLQTAAEDLKNMN